MTTDAVAQLAILADALTEIVDLATADPKTVAPPAQVLARAGDIAAEALAAGATYGGLPPFFAGRRDARRRDEFQPAGVGQKTRPITWTFWRPLENTGKFSHFVAAQPSEGVGFSGPIVGSIPRQHIEIPIRSSQVPCSRGALPRMWSRHFLFAEPIEYPRLGPFYRCRSIRQSQQYQLGLMRSESSKPPKIPNR